MRRRPGPDTQTAAEGKARRGRSAPKEIDAIERHIDDGLGLREEARLVDSLRDYELWSARFEWWCSATRAALASIFATGGAADEFDHAVGNVYRRTWQNDTETFKNQREAVEHGLRALDRLREHLARPRSQEKPGSRPRRSR